MLGLGFVRINNPEVLEDFMRRHREATDAVLRWKLRVRSTRIGVRRMMLSGLCQEVST